MNVKFAKVKPDAKTPIKGDAGNMCFDFFPCFEQDWIEIRPFEVKLIPTGIATAFDNSLGLVFRERGSTGKINLKVNSGVSLETLVNSPLWLKIHAEFLFHTKKLFAKGCFCQFLKLSLKKLALMSWLKSHQQEGQIVLVAAGVN